MKILLLLLLSISSIAGTPHQDLIVDVMRERFRAASPNMMEFDLNLEKDWKCVYYTARAGIVPNFTKYKNLFKFKRTADWSYRNTGKFHIKNFDFHEEGHFIGETDYGKVFGRKVRKDVLIFEYASAQYKRHRSYISISDKKLSGHGYIYCKLDK